MPLLYVGAFSFGGKVELDLIEGLKLAAKLATWVIVLALVMLLFFSNPDDGKEPPI